MYSNYRYNQNYNQNRGFLGPFILGGLTGGLVAPLFYQNNRPYCPNCYVPYAPYPYPYGVYYR